MPRPVAKITVPADPAMKETTTLEVYRDYSKEGDWHDQYVLNPETKVSRSKWTLTIRKSSTFVTLSPERMSWTKNTSSTAAARTALLLREGFHVQEKRTEQIFISWIPKSRSLSTINIIHAFVPMANGSPGTGKIRRQSNKNRNKKRIIIPVSSPV